MSGNHRKFKRNHSILNSRDFELQPICHNPHLRHGGQLGLAQSEVVLGRALGLDHRGQPRVLPGHDLGLLLQRLNLGEEGLEEGERLEEERLAARLRDVLHQPVQGPLGVANLLILNKIFFDDRILDE